MQGVEANHYTSNFYGGHQEGSYKSALAVLPLIHELIQPKSVIDVGCGVGTWLKVWKDFLNVPVVHGVEGAYITKLQLAVPVEHIEVHDLKTPFRKNTRYDIAMSMEVAEHLPESSADTFVESLVGLSDIVLFSAAMIGQEGTYHINEQMPEYWAEKFYKRNYVAIDYIRPLVWNNVDVMYWYRQNTLLFVNKDIIHSLPDVLKDALQHTDPSYLLRVHPDQYSRVYERRKLRNFIHYKLYRLKKAIKGE